MLRHPLVPFERSGRKGSRAAAAACKARRGRRWKIQHLANKAATRKTAEISRIKKIVETAESVAEDKSPTHNKFNDFCYYEANIKYKNETYKLYVNVGRAKNDRQYHIYDSTKRIGDTADRINGLERPKNGDALQNGISTDGIRQGTEKSQGGGVKFSLATESDGEYLSLAEKYRDGTASEEETKRLQEMADAAAEAALSDYPTDYFRQLLYGNVQSIRVELVGNLAPKADAELGETAAAFAQELPGEYLVVFDVYTLSAGNVYHEFTHVTDRRLAWDAAHREGALFSEEAWSALNPTGFAYAESYEDYPAELWQYNNSGCFVSEYSMTFPTEDRATMMEMAMTGDLLT